MRYIFALFFCFFAAPIYAQDFSLCNVMTAGNGHCPDEGTAYTVVSTRINQRLQELIAQSSGNANNRVCMSTQAPTTTAPGVVYGWITNKVYACAWPQRFPVFQFQRSYPLAGMCFTQPSINQPSSVPETSTFCQDGCEYLQLSASVAAPTASACDAPRYQCRPGFTKSSDGICKPDKVCPPDQDKVGDQCIPKPPCPLGQIRGSDGKCANNPNDPNNPDGGAGTGSGSGCQAGQVKAPDGTCINDTNQPCPRGQTRNASGVCAAGGSDDGANDDHEASGGESCSSPPTCSGDAILCLQLRMQWRIECNTRRTQTVTGGACSHLPVCTGEKCDSMEQAMLIMSWRTACAVERLAANGSTGENTSTDPDYQPSWTRVDGMPTEGNDGASPSDTDVVSVEQFDLGVIDQSGFLGGHASCPSIATGGGQLSGSFLSTLSSPPPFWCDFIRMVYWTFITLATVWAVVALLER